MKCISIVCAYFSKGGILTVCRTFSSFTYYRSIANCLERIFFQLLELFFLVKVQKLPMGKPNPKCVWDLVKNKLWEKCNYRKDAFKLTFYIINDIRIIRSK